MSVRSAPRLAVQAPNTTATLAHLLLMSSSSRSAFRALIIYPVYIFRVYRSKVNPLAHDSPAAPGGLEHGGGFLAGRFATGLATQHARQFLQSCVLTLGFNGRRRSIAAPLFADRPVMAGVAGYLRQVRY